MGKLKFLILIFILTSCVNNKSIDKKTYKLYYLSNCSYDTTYIDKPAFDTTNLSLISIKEFEQHLRFSGKVIIYKTKEGINIDGGAVYYLTPDLGIIYKKYTDWSCYSRLHSTNDSIENRINQFIENILSKTDLVIEGDTPLKDKRGVPPKIK